MTVPLVVDLKMEVFDRVIGQQLAAHRFDALTRLVHRFRLEAHLDVLADAHVFDFAEPERHQSLLDGESLGVVDNGLGRDDDPSGGPHYSLRALGGNRGLPTSRWQAVRYRSRVCATMSSCRRVGPDPVTQPDP